MTKKLHTRKYPQISREFSAVPSLLVAFFLILLSFLCGFSFFSPSPSTTLQQLLTETSKNPFSASLHLKLAKFYATHRYEGEASIEGGLAQIDSPFSPNVLGAKSDAIEFLSKLEVAPKKRVAAMEYWKKVTAEYPSYREAWVQLLYISYQEKEYLEAKLALEHIRQLDPNSITKLPKELQEL